MSSYIIVIHFNKFASVGCDVTINTDIRFEVVKNNTKFSSLGQGLTLT